MKHLKKFNEMISSGARFSNNTYKYPLDYSDFSIGDDVNYLDRKCKVVDVKSIGKDKSVSIYNKELDRTYCKSDKNGGTNGIYPVHIKKFGGKSRP